MGIPLERLAWVGILATCLSAPANAGVSLQADASGAPVVTGLTDPTDPGCSYLQYQGSVAQRKFAKDGMTLTGFILEQADGTRLSVNVYVPDDIGRGPRMTVTQALQSLLKEGQPVAGRIQACGNGPILMLDSASRGAK